jgi:putative ABC transport system ATP-binding protein
MEESPFGEMKNVKNNLSEPEKAAEGFSSTAKTIVNESPFGEVKNVENDSSMSMKTVEDFSSSYFLDKEKIVTVKDLQVVYNAGKLNEARALNGVTFDIYSEEYIVIFGHSGCGKSTVLNTIAGLEIPSAGTVIVDEKNLSTLSSDDLADFHRNQVGMIFQSYNLIPTLSVLDNVVLPLVFESRNVSERKEIGRDILRKLGIGNLEKRFPQELSGGQQQRVGIARALVTDPPIILADEAVGNLDSQSAKNVLEILDSLNLENKKTIIAVTHNPEHLFYADRVFYMRDGKLIKIEANKNRRHDPEDTKKIEITKERTELDLLMQAYPDLSTMQLHMMLAPFKAKMLVSYFLNRFETQEIQVMEKLVERRLLGQSDDQEFLEKLTASHQESGLAISHPLAEKFLETVNEVIEKSDMIKQQAEHLKAGHPDPIRRVVDKIRHSLLEEYEGTLRVEEVEALNKGIEYRVLSKISRQEFMEYLDRPFAEGGVGLKWKTAKKMSRKLETIMLVEFGA